MRKLYRIAMYLRLSKEDEDLSDESNSIVNQRRMLEEYIKKHFEQYELNEFADDGFSGTNFLRPGVADMLEQVRDGKINCVIVKDFSRFSRDYIELGSYIDQIFPFLGVRFISLNDGYDSEDYGGKTADLDISFKGLLYDLYSKDLSVKVKSSLQARKEHGQYASAHVPFGYKKDRNDRHKIILAEDEAAVVRRIFAMALDGKTSSEIARQFNREKAPTPIEVKIKKGQISRKPLGSGFQWNHSMVWAILNNPFYAGDMVYDKYSKNEVGGKNHLKPRSEWKIYKDHHMAMISREVFEQIQAQRSAIGKRNSPNRKNSLLLREKIESGWREQPENSSQEQLGTLSQEQLGTLSQEQVGFLSQERSTYPLQKQTKHPLQGKVICGGCKRAMTLRKSLNPYFYCEKKYTYADAEKCVSNVNLMFLEQFILYETVSELSRREKLEQMKRKKEEEICERLNEREKEKDQLYKRKDILQRKRLAEYEKSVFDTGYRFPKENSDIEQAEAMIAEVNQEIQSLKGELERLKQSGNSAMRFKEEWGAALTSEFVDKLIKKVTVYDEQHIEIKWNNEEENAVI